MRKAPSPVNQRMSANSLAERILSPLPEDGTPVLNRVMRVMLSREFQRPIEPELYCAARNILLDRHRIGRLRSHVRKVLNRIGSEQRMDLKIVA
jgi:hypothetical protein